MTRQRRAMAGFGQVLSGLGQDIMDKLLEARVNSEFTEGKALWTQRNNEYLESLRGEQDYKNIPGNYEKFNKKIQQEVLSLASTKRANTGLKNFMIQEYPKRSRDVSLIAFAKERDYMRASTLNAVNIHIKDRDAPSAITAIIRGRNAGYIGDEEAEIRIQRISQEVDWNAGIEDLQADPVEFLQDIDDEDYLESLDAERRSQLKSAARQVIAGNKRDLAEQKRVLQEQTASQLLADFWDGKLIDPQIITDAVRDGLIKDTDSKYLRDALLNPDPPTLNLKSYADVKEAITDIGTGAKTRSEALAILYKNINSIDPTTGKSLVAEIFAEQDKGDAEMKREGRNLMEDLIRDRDPFSGFFSDDARQILGTSEAILILDAEIQKAATAGKPLPRREILIKAVEIGRQIKAKIKREEADAIPPSFSPETEGYPTAPRAPDFTIKDKPIKKGALAKPDFVLDTEGEPEKVFDDDGRETGLRRKGGAIFKIGFHAIFGDKIYEYTGNGNWKLVK